MPGIKNQGPALAYGWLIDELHDCVFLICFFIGEVSGLEVFSVCGVTHTPDLLPYEVGSMSVCISSDRTS